MKHWYLVTFNITVSFKDKEPISATPSFILAEDNPVAFNSSRMNALGDYGAKYFMENNKIKEEDIESASTHVTSISYLGPMEDFFEEETKNEDHE